jgi:alanine racemase
MAYITLNKNNFFNNLDIIAKQTKTRDKIALVLKDNAYGHGILEISQMAQEYGITKCVVQKYEEAKSVESFFDYILVLADRAKGSCEKARYTINDLDAISEFPRGTKVELKVDTGMHRNGIAPAELYTAFTRIKEQGLILEALFTHYRSADELTSEWFWQKENFKKVKNDANKLLEEFGFSKLRFHSSNSAALFRENDFGEDMARVGIAAYGCMELPKPLAVEGFKSVLSLWAKKISSRKLQKGQRVGYGANFIAKESSSVSNYSFGYGDGFLRCLSNKYVTPDGIQIAGRISMDNSSFVSDKDELLIFNDAQDVAKVANTISYEILTSLKEKIPRNIV